MIHGPEWPLSGCETLGEPQTLCVLWFSQMCSEDNHSPSLVGLLGRRWVSVPGMERNQCFSKVWSGDSCGR